MTAPARAGWRTGWSRLAEQVLLAMPADEIAGVWQFLPLRMGRRELGVAIVARRDAERRRIYTARYALTIRGKERGGFEAQLEEVGSGPAEAMDQLLLELQSEEHLSVDTVVRRLREQGVRVGTATVYRTLDVLVQSGLVRAHDFGEGFRRYEPVPAQAHHEHLICVRCGAVLEFQNDRLERMLPIIADELAFQHQRHRVEIYGVCRSCRQRDVGGLVP
ncbi:MAG: transcriptional repressor [Gemmatimonadales bacterium]|nr:transcriptional repressor [Gemmatimonadales bacterium]